jgi:uncharacterized protein YegP (UPF0339 family)
VTKFVRSIALAAAIAGLVSAAGTSVAPAQDKKKDVKASKDDAGTVELNADVKGMYRFKVVGADGKTIMQSSKGYEKKEDALKAIETVKGILSRAKVTEGKGDDEKDVKKDAKKDAKKKDPGKN